ncbi:MAG: 16S rRNA processing protein RimM [Gammaproteobacteria bacterium]|jgi:16S rRNA processing protein RimM
MTLRESLVCVGHILAAQGIDGKIRVFSRTSPRENILSYSPWLMEKDGRLEEIVVSGKRQGKLVVATIDGIDNRDQAEALIGNQLYITPDQLPELDNDDYYWSDLIGMRVYSVDGEYLGEITDMLETGADDVMVVAGDQKHLIPFVLKDLVKRVDRQERRVLVDWKSDY